MKPATRALLLVGSVIAGLMLLEVLFPPHSAYYKAKAILRWIAIASGLGTAAIDRVITQRRITWNHSVPSYNAAALQAPFGTMSSHVATAAAGLPQFVVAGVSYRPCSVRLQTGFVIPRCVLLDELAFARLWPGRPPVAPAVRIEHVAELTPSAATLDARTVQRIEAATPPSHAVVRRFRFIFDNGNEAVVAVGTFAAIPELPVGRTAAQVLDVVPADHPNEPVHESSPATLCIYAHAPPTG